MSKKPKDQEIDLIVAVVCCLIFGVAQIAFAYHLHGTVPPPNRPDWPNLATAFISAQAQLLHTLLYQWIPMSGGGFLFIGFIIWNYRRKKKRLKDSHEPDA